MRRRPVVESSPRPFGGYFDEVYDALQEAYPAFDEAIEKVVVDRGELTIHVRADKILEVCQVMRDDEALRVHRACDGGTPMRAVLPRLGIAATPRTVDRLRIHLASTAFPYLRAV